MSSPELLTSKVTLQVPAWALGNPTMEHNLKILCDDYKSKGVEVEIEIFGKKYVSKATKDGCHKGIVSCNGCCPLKYKKCHCSCTDTEKHVNVCNGGYSNCSGCDPCGSPDCHSSICNVYHEGTTIYFGDGDSYDPYE